MTRRRAQKGTAKDPAGAKPPPASTGSNGWEWWNETQQVRQQPAAAAAAASTAKWDWWSETQKEHDYSDTSWSMVATPQDNDEVMMPDSKKHKPPDGAVRMSLEAPPLDPKPPSGAQWKKGMTCAHVPSASTAAAMSSLAPTGYSTPEPEDAALVCEPEPPEAEG
eukprot:6464506-Amphidinium_carterae.1